MGGTDGDCGLAIAYCGLPMAGVCACIGSFRNPKSAIGDCRYSYIPSLPPSLPKPDSRYPPNPEAASNRLVELIQTTPAFSFGATSSARLMFSDHTLAARPYGVLFASSTASCGVRNVMLTSTGPKISTCAIVAAGETSVNSVGG